MEQLKIDNIAIAFAPVAICFALSPASIFATVIDDSNSQSNITKLESDKTAFLVGDCVRFIDDEGVNRRGRVKSVYYDKKRRRLEITESITNRTLYRYAANVKYDRCVGTIAQFSFEVPFGYPKIP